MDKRPIIVIDMGSQTSRLIARRLRELGCFTEILSATCSKDQILGKNPYALIISGSNRSTGEVNHLSLSFPLCEIDLPILGICYGFQLLCKEYGGTVRSTALKEFGRCLIKIDDADPLLGRLDPTVWMSHGDSVETLPDGFVPIATSENGLIAAARHESKPIFGLQFHPEVTHTIAGVELFRRFAFDFAGAEQNWTLNDIHKGLIDDIHGRIGSARVLCAISGGVDSLVATTLVGKAIGNRAEAFFIDTGLLRKNEVKEVEIYLRSQLHIGLKVIDARELFLAALSGVSDPEIKRKKIGATFIEVFSKAAINTTTGFLMQGTIYPDVIESTQIKSHHNVGGLPENLDLTLLEPLRYLFKDEVRAIGKLIGLPERLLDRHPFPGPGLAIRILGEVNESSLETLREADDIFVSYLREKNLYSKTWQAFAVLLPIKTVGVKGDARSYENCLVLRAIDSIDGMTAAVSPFSIEDLSEIAGRICNRVPGINRVVYDVTTKPPATIEWE